MSIVNDTLEYMNNTRIKQGTAYKRTAARLQPKAKKAGITTKKKSAKK